MARQHVTYTRITTKRSVSVTPKGSGPAGSTIKSSKTGYTKGRKGTTTPRCPSCGRFMKKS